MNILRALPDSQLATLKEQIALVSVERALNKFERKVHPHKAGYSISYATNCIKTVSYILATAFKFEYTWRIGFDCSN